MIRGAQASPFCFSGFWRACLPAPCPLPLWLIVILRSGPAPDDATVPGVGGPRSPQRGQAEKEGLGQGDGLCGRRRGRGRTDRLCTASDAGRASRSSCSFSSSWPACGRRSRRRSRSRRSSAASADGISGGPRRRRFDPCPGGSCSSRRDCSSGSAACSCPCRPRTGLRLLGPRLRPRPPGRRRPAALHGSPL